MVIVVIIVVFVVGVVVVESGGVVVKRSIVIRQVKGAEVVAMSGRWWLVVAIGVEAATALFFQLQQAEIFQMASLQLQ